MPKDYTVALWKKARGKRASQEVAGVRRGALVGFWGLALLDDEVKAGVGVVGQLAV
jgi:hypothetical protein